MDYSPLRKIHVACVLLSISLFAVRGAWMMAGTLGEKGRWVRIVPHVIDTALLASAVALAVTIRQYPGTSAWLTAKVAGLVAYIVLGTIALKRGKSRRVRIAAFCGALAVFVYIVGVAVTRDPFLR
jgi:uncharacterized membrane protein SirB2